MTEPNQSSDGSDDNQVYTAEYKDGQLHIVEVSPYDKEGDANQIAYEVDGTLPEASNDDDDGEQTKYLQLDLLNFTVLKNADGTNTYEMVSADGAGDDDDTTITCVLSNDDIDEETTGSYVMLETGDDQDPYMFLQSGESAEPIEPTTSVTVDQKPEPKPAPSKSTSKQLTPIQILEKAKALQKSKALTSLATRRSRGRKKSDLPAPMELLSSPNFKLYLYSCKMCTFKCNAVKEMSQHKKAEHLSSVRAASTSTRVALLQCARCPYRGHTHKQLLNHIDHSHKEPEIVSSDYITALQLDSEEVEAADVLVCGACGFESGDRTIFRKHIVDEHGAITSVD